MASKLVGVRLPPRVYQRLQTLKKDLGAASDAEAIRTVIEEFPRGLAPSMMPVFSAPLRARRSRRSRAGLKDLDEVLYGEGNKHVRRLRRAQARRRKARG